MFYDAIQNKHGLKHDPFKALMVPRPIGWISTVSDKGVCNIAPYSYFNAMGDRPHYVTFGSGGMKDTLRNIAENGEFVCSLSTWDLREHMNTTSATVPYGVDEYPLAGLTAVASNLVKPPRVKESPVAFECRHWKTIELPAIAPQKGGFSMVIGYVVGIHIDERFIKDGIVDTAAMRPLARLGYMDYAVVTPETKFTMNRPEVDDAGNLVAKNAGAWDGKYR